MPSTNRAINNVPTNIITGFLGVGKTTTIIHLLKNKPRHERWAILVNEFGEIGVDGNLLQGQYTEEGGVFIREVPGGCMCCAAGLPMQIALNQLLSCAQPDRLLIEPTGLGHPKEVLEVLTAEHYRDVLNIQKCVTLVDARKLDEKRYTEHDTFNQQIDIADIIVGNKQDLYENDDKIQLLNYIKKRKGQGIQIIFSSHGEINPDILEGLSISAKTQQHLHHGHHQQVLRTDINDQPLPESGYLSVENAGEGYVSIGWRFSPEIAFNRQALYNWLNGLEADRLKGVFVTHEGVFGYNLTQDALTEMELDDCSESRVEIIAQKREDSWEHELLILAGRISK